MPPAVIAAGVGAAASIGGGLIASNGTKKATQQATDSQLQAARENNALAERVYQQNRSALSPWMQRGNVAGDAYSALLGLPANNNSMGYAQIGASGGPQQSALQPGLTYDDGQAPGASRYLISSEMNFDPNGNPIGPTPSGPLPSQIMSGAVDYPQAGYVTTQQPGMTPQTAQGAFQNYLGSTGYQFRLGEGMRALDMGAASRGASQSGAAIKSALRYGQNIGSDYFGQYMNLLNNQQSLGLSGASALAGVGQSYAGSVMSNNQNAADAASNAALIRGSANSQLWQGIGGSLGNLLGSSYGIWGR